MPAKTQPVEYTITYKIHPEKQGDLHYDDWHCGYRDCSDKKFPEHFWNLINSSPTSCKYLHEEAIGVFSNVRWRNARWRRLLHSYQGAFLK
ncbi:MAG TPA: hypothetical protein VK203_23685 [Nostocaceae cyanobacterium]|nr:hypothetical protein [Nostocaceae cyanobacterium]